MDGTSVKNIYGWDEGLFSSIFFGKTVKFLSKMLARNRDQDTNFFPR